MNDTELLRQYAQHGSAEAFRELVARHTNLVHACARQRLHDDHAAQDVTQAAFLALAQQAKQLSLRGSLSAWLYGVTRHLCLNHLRREQRRQEREMRAFADQPTNEPGPTSTVWAELEPHLADALDALSGVDREVVLLRFYRQASYRQIAELLRISEDAAEKRVSRALEKLRGLFAKRGVTLSAAALAGLLTANAAPAAPAGLAASVASAALAGTGTLAWITTGGISIMSTKLKVAAVAAVVCLLAGGAGLYVWQRNPEPSVPALPTATANRAPVPAGNRSTTTSMAVTTTSSMSPLFASETLTGRGLILRQANPPMEITDSRGQRYAARNVTNFTSAVWRHYSHGMDPYFCDVFRVTEAEQIQMQKMLDSAWQGADALATCFAVTPTDNALQVTWKGEAFRDVYRVQREATRNQVLTGAHGILGADRGEVLGWLPQAGNIGWPDVLPDPARVSSDYRLTVSVTNVNGLIAMRYAATLGDKRSVSGQNPGLGPWPGLGEQLGVPRQTVLSNLAAQRQKPMPKGLIQYRDPSEPLDEVPLAAEDTATGKRYLYTPVPAR